MKDQIKNPVQTTIKNRFISSRLISGCRSKIYIKINAPKKAKVIFPINTEDFTLFTSFINLKLANRIEQSLKNMSTPNHTGKSDLIIRAKIMTMIINLSATGSRIFPNSVSWCNFLARYPSAKSSKMVKRNRPIRRKKFFLLEFKINKKIKGIKPIRKPLRRLGIFILVSTLYKYIICSKKSNIIIVFYGVLSPILGKLGFHIP
jgi:hypothetical protein